MTPILLVILASFVRLLPHPPNFAPVSAAAIFAGASLPRPIALLVPLAIMAVTDRVLGFGYHSTMPYVYASFLISSLIGIWLGRSPGPLRVGFAALAASLQFFFITNFGVWATGTMYPHSFAGLLESYFMGLPFLKNTLLSDFAYTYLLFGAYACVRSVLNVKRKAQNEKQQLKTQNTA